MLDTGKFKDKHTLVIKDIEQHINDNDLLDLFDFIEELKLIKASFPKSNFNKALKALEKGCKNIDKFLEKTNKK